LESKVQLIEVYNINYWPYKALEHNCSSEPSHK